MKKLINAISIISMSVTLVACSIDQEREISGTYADINALQILDPMAPENNAGVVNSLDGKVANKVMNGYQKSTYAPKEGRAAATFQGME
ncbi:MAG: hypothetical protein V7782_12365 [Psychromonas sp.]